MIFRIKGLSLRLPLGRASGASPPIPRDYNPRAAKFITPAQGPQSERERFRTHLSRQATSVAGRG